MNEVGLVWLSECESTNDECRRRLDDPTLHAVASDHQTHGRGRRGRTWFSPRGDGLYLSIIIRPHFAASALTALPLLAGIVVAELVGALGKRAALKWPNDVLVDGKKVAGILCESLVSGERAVAIIGIGLNLREPADGFPEGLHATALGTPVPSITLAHVLTRRLLAHVDRLPVEDPLASVVHTWQQWSLPLGTPMRQASQAGAYAGLDREGSLRLLTDTSEVRIHSGEVELVALPPLPRETHAARD